MKSACIISSRQGNEACSTSQRLPLHTPGLRAVPRQINIRTLRIQARMPDREPFNGRPGLGYDQQPRVSNYDYAPAPPRIEQVPPPRGPPNNSRWDDGNGPGGGGGMSGATKALIAGAFILGMGAGVWFDSEANFTPDNVASTYAIDANTPNAEVCLANGFSSMVFDQRVFVSFNPFNVYVTQPEVKPGCVLRRANVQVLESRGLVSTKQVQSCKNRMNTFAYVGDLNQSPEVTCVYHSEDAENQYMKGKPVLGDGYQPREGFPVPTSIAEQLKK